MSLSTVNQRVNVILEIAKYAEGERADPPPEAHELDSRLTTVALTEAFAAGRLQSWAIHFDEILAGYGKIALTAYGFTNSDKYRQDVNATVNGLLLHVHVA